jgi:PAS domain-containing protein
LLLILLGLLFFANQQGWIPDAARWWEIFAVGMGSILIIDAIIHYIDPVSRSFTAGRLVPGIIFLFIGLAFLFGWNNWWPLALVGTGCGLFFSSWVVQREIEKRRITQETLQQSEIKYRHIIDNANSIIMEMDTKADVTFINKFGQEFFGYSESDLVGHNIRSGSSGPTNRSSMTRTT